MYQWDWSVVFSDEAWHYLQVGLAYTVLLSVIALTIGSIVGLVMAVTRLWGPRYVRTIAVVYVEFFRTTPMLVQILWVFYVLPTLLNIRLGAVESGALALGLNSGAFLAEIFRAGLVSIHQSQHDAAQVLGLSRLQSLRLVILPQALRRVLPAISNVFISLVKDSSLVSVIAVYELTYQAGAFVSETFRPFEIYTALAVVYFLLTYPLVLVNGALERRFRVT